MALLKQFGPQDEEILKQMQIRQQPAPAMQAQPSYVAPEQQGFFQRLGAGVQNFTSDPEKMARLTMALNSMRMQPDAGIAAMAQSRMENAQQQKLLQSQANKTAKFFEDQDRDDLAMAIRQNPAIASDILKAYYSSQFKSPSAFAEKVDALVAANVPRAEAVKMVATSSGTTVNLPSGAETAMYKAASDRDFALQDQAYKAASQIAGLDQTIDLIQSGEANIGMASQFQQELARMKAFFGDEESIKSASSTALLNALLGQDVFGAISNLGIGARGLDTPAEREFLRDVLTGTTRMTPEALLKMTNLRKKYAEKVIEKYNEAIDRGQFKYISNVLGPERFQKIDYISSDQLNNPPSGVDPVTWSYMSREEKIQYLNEAKGAGN